MNNNNSNHVAHNINNNPQQQHHKNLHIAPMLDVSTPEFHHFFRILTKKAILWTEMVVDETIVYSPNLDEHLLITSHHLHPIICQIGGRNVDYCTKAVKAVREYGYEEVNLNVDCPSGRVSGKRLFGAVLMAEEHQETCLEVVSAMKESSECDHDNDDDRTKKHHIPISVKTRVGIQTNDGQCHDNIEYISNFLSQLHQRGCNRFVIHARICVIGGLLSPAQNRLVPPLNYPRVYELCRRFPDCEFVINGGIPGLRVARDLCFGIMNDDDDCCNNGHDHENQHHVVPCKICNAPNGSCTAPPPNPQSTPSNLTGCMIGRACMENPSMFWDVDRYFYGMDDNPCHTRREVLEQYCLYLEKTYPRRCCDDDDRVTMRIPCPEVDLPNWGCLICNDYYGKCDNPVRKEITSQQFGGDDEKKMKISSRVIDRSLKPILGMFFGLPKSKLFRRECDRLSRDKSIRNCGPGYIVRRAMSVMPHELLDQNFVKTEDLDYVPTHVSPSEK